jgi:hypothetical protein
MDGPTTVHQDQARNGCNLKAERSKRLLCRHEPLTIAVDASGETMRLLAVLVLLSSAPAFAADHTPWFDKSAPFGRLQELAQRGDRCCMHCKKGKPCGNSCIATNKKCHQPPGCAC